MLDFIDLNFQGQKAVIATAVIRGHEGVALVDPGPSTTLPTLKKALKERGMGLDDVTAILLTHIHLDHAGGTGTLIAESARANVYVHERGAPHMADPSKLVASASRLYGADMDTLWGEVRAVPNDRLRVLGDRDQFEIGGLPIESAWTPGHAWHHVSYFMPHHGIAYVGDTAGIARPDANIIVPPTPPPDIDLEAWRASTERILAWQPAVLFLTHFGPQMTPAGHFEALWARIDDWSTRVRDSLDKPGTDEERAAAFTSSVAKELTKASGKEQADAYASAARFDFSWTGLARYWRKKATS